MESMKDQRIAAFLALDAGYGDGSGDGSGSGWNDGSGYGFGEGSGEGWCFRFGGGFGGGPCFNDGSGSGSDDGSGCGSGYGSGCGSGYGSLRWTKSFCGKLVYMINDVPILIDKVSRDVAKGRILRNDMTTTPCFVVKGGGYFAHGDTLRGAMDALRGAMDALREKQFKDMPEDERIEALIKAHEHGKQYPWLICTSGTTIKELEKAWNQEG